MDHSLAQVASTFRSPATVCEFLFLHLNVHGCQPSTVASGNVLKLVVGPKRASASGASYTDLRVAHRGHDGDLPARRAARGKRAAVDEQLPGRVEAVPLDDKRSFVHLGYAYSYGMMAKLAMQAYLATAGRAKIGFTVVGQDADGKPIYVRGERAALERNVTRYYLALLAHCAVSGKPPQEQTEARLRAWFALTRSATRPNCTSSIWTSTCKKSTTTWHGPLSRPSDRRDDRRAPLDWRRHRQRRLARLGLVETVTNVGSAVSVPAVKVR